eukprot:TRINITY_DN10449_c0_g1_i3.p1 TRINITY_DN10449_c0_g1~~TRINITY_DN10449_c0_g1_i3.p1  ORF type:complete len:472 (+),score=112.85 TRINITY_DN10449_c0_g1_i3:170-1585(+)
MSFTDKTSEGRKSNTSANINGVFYADSYHPIQAGSIDGTDITPHDNGVYRALICALTGLYDPTSDTKVIGDPYCTVFVGRLSHSTTEESLKHAMGKYGRVKKLRLVRHIVTGASEGYAFVEYETDREMRHAYEGAHHSIIDGSQVVVDYSRQQLMPGWIPRRLGGGLGGRKESGQLRFGGRERPFRAPLRPVPHEELKKLGIPPPPEGHYMSRFQVPPPPSRREDSKRGNKRVSEASGLSYDRYQKQEFEKSNKRFYDRDIDMDTDSENGDSHYESQHGYHGHHHNERHKGDPDGDGSHYDKKRKEKSNKTSQHLYESDYENLQEQEEYEQERKRSHADLDPHSEFNESDFSYRSNHGSHRHRHAKRQRSHRDSHNNYYEKKMRQSNHRPEKSFDEYHSDYEELEKWQEAGKESKKSQYKKSNVDDDSDEGDFTHRSKHSYHRYPHRQKHEDYRDDHDSHHKEKRNKRDRK